MMKFFQRLGRSLMLPVAILPAAAILMGVGYWLDPSGWGGNNTAALFLIKSGGAIIDNMGILFAVGVALGMSKDNDGAAALSGLVAFLIVTTLLSTNTVAGFQGIKPEEVNLAFSKINNQFIGIISGLVAASMYNHFNQLKLPTALAFFSGKRSVAIMTSLAMLVVSAILYFIWPVVFSGLVTFGKGISGLGFIGAGIYGFFNRLLIPTGLHHALNSVFWFDVAGISDIGKFWASEGTKGVTGMYQAGFFPMMMFGLPAGAFAIYQSARPEKKKMVGSLMLAGAFASFFTGITEPLEFSFMFAAPLLYLLHAALTGLSLAIAAFFHWTAGFGFSAGLVDYVLSLKIPIANKPLFLLLQGLVFAAIYYIVFRFAITKFNLMTPGREADSITGPEKEDVKNNFTTTAEIIYDGLGGKENIEKIDNCVTRLRITVKDMNKVDKDKIKSARVAGINVVGEKDIQVIIGTQVQFVADELTKIYKKS